jgi:2-dehydropantoate 2-reductase
MKVAVMGAGAVGNYYGAMLARAGHAVTLIGRPPLVDAVRAQGLLLESTHFTGPVALDADTRPEAVAGAGLVLFCVKSGDTASAGAQIAPHLSPDAAVLSLQNGVDNADTLGQALGRPAIPAVVYVATDMAGPGHVRHHGRGELVIGPSPRSEEIATLLRAAAIPTTVSAQVRDALWAKLVINCAYNALSAISQLPYGELVRGHGVLAVMRDAFDECTAVAQAQAVQLPADLWDAVVAIAGNMAAQRSSTAQDLARGKPSEIDHLNGTIVRLGAQAGIATPVNRTLHTLVKLLETSPR